RVSESGEPVTMATVAHSLTKAGSGVDPTLITDLYGAAPMAGDVAWFGERVADEAKFRALASAGVKVRDAAMTKTLDIGEARDLARSVIDQATTGNTRKVHVRVGDVLPEVLDIADHGANPALSTPWPD